MVKMKWVFWITSLVLLTTGGQAVDDVSTGESQEAEPPGLNYALYGPGGSCCTAWGDPHHMRWDKRMFHFQGGCEYYLAVATNGSETEFAVVIENEFRNAITHVTYVKMVKIIMRSEYELMKDHLFKVNDVHQNVPFSDNYVEVTRNRLNTVVRLLNKDVYILWNGQHRVVVCVGEEYKGKMSGLCGPYLDVVEDNIPAPNANDYWIPYGDSHRVSPTCTVQTPSGPECTEEELTEAAKPNRCGLLGVPNGPFADCYHRAAAFDACKYDICAAYPEEEIMNKLVCESFQEAHEVCSPYMTVGNWWDTVGCDDDTFKPVDRSGYSRWSEWSACSVNCGTVGTRERTRICEQDTCTGPDRELVHCDRADIPCFLGMTDCAAIRDHAHYQTKSNVLISVGGTVQCLGVLITNVVVLTVSECVPAGTQVDQIKVIFEDESEKAVKVAEFVVGVTLIELWQGAYPRNHTSSGTGGDGTGGQAVNPGGTEGTGAPAPPSGTLHLPQLTFGDFGMLGGMCLFEGQIVVYLQTLDKSLCKIPESDHHYFCLGTSMVLDNVLGAAVLVVNDLDKVLLVGLVAEKITDGVVKVLDLEHSYDALGCDPMVDGVWSAYFNVDDPGDDTDNEHWATYDQAVCGTNFPLCVDPAVSEPAQQFFKYVSADCPSEQVIDKSVRTGFLCDSSNQPAACLCHDYKIRVKCPYST